MISASSGFGDFGINLNPIKAVKTGARLVAHPVSTVKSGAKLTAYAVKHPIKATKFVARQTGDAAKQVGQAVKTGVLKPAEFIAHAATQPLRSRVHTLRDRRARKLAWDRRKSKTPDAKDRRDAKNWTKSKLHKSGPQGYLLALFAGPADDYVTLSGMDVYGSGLGFDPATASIIAASIPVFMAILNVMLSKANKSGEAPVDPSSPVPASDAAALSPEAEGGMTPGAVDMSPVQDAAAAAEEAAQDAAGGGGMVKLPGGVHAKKSHLLLGAAVVGGLVVVLLVMRSKKG